MVVGGGTVRVRGHRRGLAFTTRASPEPELINFPFKIPAGVNLRGRGLAFSEVTGNQTLLSGRGGINIISEPGPTPDSSISQQASGSIPLE